MNFFILLVVCLGMVSCFAYANAQTVIPWNGFAFSDFGYDNRTEYGMFTEEMKQISILQVGKQYQIIQKVEFRANDLKNATLVNATVGYAIQQGDKMVRPPMGDNVTEAEHQAFARQIPQRNEEFIQSSTIGNSFDFVVDVKNPFYIKFPIQLNESGLYTWQYYKTTHMFEGPNSAGMGGLSVVDKYSKALDENGICKKDSLRRVIKYDFSNLVCVEPENALKLKQRGWAL